MTMLLEDFTYELPPELIAKYPSSNRSDSRLLQVSEAHKALPELSHLIFKNIIDLFKPGDLLILNNTKVLSARFYGEKPTGAKIEFLMERILTHNEALVHIKANRAPKMGSSILLYCPSIAGTYSVTVDQKVDNLYRVTLVQPGDDTAALNWYELLDQIGSLPLPHYINRNLAVEDQERYQTVFADKLGAVAAPTAGLHFTQELLQDLQKLGVIIKYVTLHVGSGTFAPVRVEDITQHKMHSESYAISSDTIKSIHQALAHKNRIIAVGTTSLRCLESAADQIKSSEICSDNEIYGDTNIFIYPGYQFKLVDCLITNFHLPGSTLMMLVSAFAGLSTIQHVYQQAIENKYRFYSYGDAMWLTRNNYIY